MDYLILYARVRLRIISICAFWDGFATNLMKTLIICPALNKHGLVRLIMCVSLCVRLCISTPLHGSAGNCVGIFYGPQRVAWATWFVCARLRALCECVHCTHARVHIVLDGFSPKLMETCLGSQKLALHAWFSRARFRVHTTCMRMHACTHIHAGMHSHIFGRINSKIGGNIPLYHGLHNFYMRACMYTLCTHHQIQILLFIK
jgi:hypothetical protein